MLDWTVVVGGVPGRCSLEHLPTGGGSALVEPLHNFRNVAALVGLCFHLDLRGCIPILPSVLSVEL